MSIDLGTTALRACITSHSTVLCVTDENGNISMPAVVAFTQEGVLLGQKAKEQFENNPHNTVIGRLA